MMPSIVIRPPLTIVVGYAADHSPKLPSRTSSHVAEPTIEGHLVPDGSGRYLAHAAIISAVIAGRYPLPTTRLFYGGSHKWKEASKPYSLYHTTINLRKPFLLGVCVCWAPRGTMRMSVSIVDVCALSQILLYSSVCTCNRNTSLLVVLTNI